jgi:signal transduction histidine kinase
MVMIKDDRRGFQPMRTRGLGLVGMQERVESLGGSLIIESAPGKGTAIGACVPMPARREVRPNAPRRRKESAVVL